MEKAEHRQANALVAQCIGGAKSACWVVAAISLVFLTLCAHPALMTTPADAFSSGLPFVLFVAMCCSCPGNLEQIHNSIHSTLGSTEGEMG
jgi:hypothetical protein